MQSTIVVIVLLASGCLGLPTGKYYSQPAPGTSFRHGGHGYFTDRIQHFNLNHDGSYDFGYNTGDGSFRSEKKDGGLVSGKYGRTSPDGTFVNVEYQAPSTGRDDSGAYRDSSRPLAPVPQPAQPKPSDVKAFHYSTVTSHGASASSGPAQTPVSAPASGAPITPAHTYLAKDALPGFPSGPASGAAFPAVTSYSSGGRAGYSFKVDAAAVQQYSGASGVRGSTYQGEAVVPDFTLNDDGTYDFQFQTSQQYRKESKGRDGNVRGDFGYASPDGTKKSYNYVAGSGLGFQVSGTDLPVQPQVPQQPYTHRQTYSTVPRLPSLPTSSVKAVHSAQRYSYSPSVRHYEDESPKPFSFAYSAGDHGRTESQDAQGVVRGSYTVNSPDGTQKQVTYKADDDGFTILDEKVTGGHGGSIVSGGYSAHSSAAGARRAYGQKSGYAYTGPWN